MIREFNVVLFSVGIAVFPCEVIPAAGEYEARLLNAGGETLATSQPIHAEWPEFNLTLPTNHIAQDEVHPGLLSRYINKRITCKTQTGASPFSLDVSVAVIDSLPSFISQCFISFMPWNEAYTLFIPTLSVCAGLSAHQKEKTTQQN